MQIGGHRLLSSIGFRARGWFKLEFSVLMVQGQGFGFRNPKALAFKYNIEVGVIRIDIPT